MRILCAKYFIRETCISLFGKCLVEQSRILAEGLIPRLLGRNLGSGLALGFKPVILFFFLLTWCYKVTAQDTLPSGDTLDFYEMSIEQLLNLKAHGVSSELEKRINSLINVASKKPLSSRESPGIVTLITRDEIKNSGARDLMDILNLVPGIDFGVDVEGVVGLGMRGNWSHEGKVLVLLDGQEMNENLFATTQFGNHFAVDQIKRVEIIRGPGSAIYGGFAEYGVINIITQTAEDIEGISLTGSYGQMQQTYARRNVNFSLGRQFKNLGFNLSAFSGQGNRSDHEFTDIYGDSYNMAGNSSLNPTNINLGLTMKGLSFRGIMDQYKTTVRDGYDQILTSAYKEDFTSYFSELKYNLKIGEKLSLTPKVNYKYQIPWRTYANDSTEEYYKTVERVLGNLTASYDLTRRINIIAGTEAYNETAYDKSDSGVFPNNERQVNYLNQAGFIQTLIKHHYVNLILGGRYDHHSEYGSAFSPRLGLTKKLQKVHFKLLYSNSFRAPSIENITYQTETGISPEKTQVMELEMGYQLSKKSIFTVNFFDIATNDPIVYLVDSVTQEDTYVNSGRSGSSGIEAEYKITDTTWGYLTINYAFYTVGNKEKVADYEVPENENVLLAFPAHKISLNGHFKISDKLSINPSLLFRSSRYAYTSVDTSGSSVIEKLPPFFIGNIFLSYENLFTKGFDVGIGVYNVLNEKVLFIQPYNGYHAPLPGVSREFIFKINYHIPFKSSASKK